jgi:hypothetical protein
LHVQPEPGDVSEGAVEGGVGVTKTGRGDGDGRVTITAIQKTHAAPALANRVVCSARVITGVDAERGGAVLHDGRDAHGKQVDPGRVEEVVRVLPRENVSLLERDRVQAKRLRRRRDVLQRRVDAPATRVLRGKAQGHRLLP